MYNLILVDDEIRSIEAIAENINWRKCGIRNLYKAQNIEEAIQIINTHKIDILICDIEMPNGSGLNLLEWVNANQHRISCIFVTCHPEFTYMRKAIQLNCYDYVLKPIDYEEFSRILRGLVRKMEALEMGETNISGLNWGDITQHDIYKYSKKEEERNVEMEVKKYVREHMKENISISDIADELHFNPQYLMRTFKNITGLSIIKYITKIRIDTSKTLLTDTPLSIKEIANLSGYGDYAYFTRVFRKEVGISPSKFRKNHYK